VSDFTPFDEAGHMAQIEAGMEAYARAHAKPTMKGHAMESIEVKYPPDDFLQGCQTGGYVRIYDENGENPIEVFIGHIGQGIVVGPTDCYSGMTHTDFTTLVTSSDGTVAMLVDQDREFDDWSGTIEKRFDLEENSHSHQNHQILEDAKDMVWG
jgi:hypothetical protein